MTFDWNSTAALELVQACFTPSIPAEDTCVFYTSLNKEKAIQFAAQFDKRTIYDMYDLQWFDTSLYPAKYWYKNDRMRGVFVATSRVYAMSCSGAATLVIPRDETPCQESIWWMHEYDAIMKRVSRITELSRVSFVGKADSIWRWSIGLIGKVVEDGAQVGRWQASAESKSLIHEYDALRKCVVKITELSQASFVEQADCIMRWSIGSIGKRAVDGEQVGVREASADSAERKGHGKRGWKRMLDKEVQQPMRKADDNGLLGKTLEKLKFIETFGPASEEWALPCSSSCEL